MGDSTRPAIRARRNVGWIAAGVLAICLGGLGAALLYANLSSAASVITIKHSVYRDQVISADDLGITSLAPPMGLETVPAERLGEIVGKTALTDLAAGGLLGPGSFGEPVVAAGAVRVGLRLDPGRLPNSPLPAGTGVRLIPVGRDGAAAPGGMPIAATVASLPQLQADGSTLLDVTVPEESGERVAQLAAAGQLALIRLPQAPR
ncbi:SAF domain-containing protein [Propionicimonas sp.]|uniref:SAF domain-containing protein n=1 Tax=Propionicimonas sp. TaxID=1955623 RepID=UPI0018172FBB|nr:SAF domain-containing protein [Propionicimonas sp.]MBU3976283.1 hypothetical protein [Actinomycetota bacterium]MBA3022123.1 hypothetical protein [Propionicimonas sp.]MBU3987440.1 hypothetical protein [Actinomycetota bacterium]MBU4006615.1 hypothetical protein [Actinomycetota bacterium]MBU4065220.1 hypothetical protein [Actinomycetota bacterium]